MRSKVGRIWSKSSDQMAWSFFCASDFSEYDGGITRAWPGGRLTPPSRIFAIAQKRTSLSTWNLGGLLIQQFDIVRGNFFEIRRKFFEIWSILWRHYTPLLVENWSNFAGLWKTQFLMKTQIKNIKRRKMRSSTRWLSRFFKILGFWPLNFQKIGFFWKMIPKIQNIQNFQKTGTYVIHLLVVYQCTKFQVNSSIFGPQMECFCLRKHTHLWRHFFKCDFCNFWGRTQKQMTPLDFWAETGQDWYLFCPHL